MRNMSHTVRASFYQQRRSQPATVADSNILQLGHLLLSSLSCFPSLGLPELSRKLVRTQICLLGYAVIVVSGECRLVVTSRNTRLFPTQPKLEHATKPFQSPRGLNENLLGSQWQSTGTLVDDEGMSARRWLWRTTGMIRSNNDECRWQSNDANPILAKLLTTND